MKRSRGLSLVEVLVAVVIMAVLGLAVIGAHVQSAREVQTTSDYTLAFLLSQKLAEQILQSSTDSPHADVALLSLAGGLCPIREGKHPLFVGMEDIAAPEGRLESRTDLSIREIDPGLERLYGNFSLALSTSGITVEDLPDKPAHLLGIALNLQWAGLKGNTRSFSFPITVVKSMIAPRSTPAAVGDDEELEEAIRQLLFSGLPGIDLTGAITEAQAQDTMVRNLGTIAVVINSTLDRLHDMDVQIVDAQLNLPPEEASALEHALAHSKISRLQSRKAALAWQALLYMAEPAWRISTNFRKEDLGTMGPSRARLLNGLLSSGLTFDQIVKRETENCLRSMITARGRVPSLGTMPFWTLRLEQRILETGKLQALILQSTDIRFIADWIDYLAEIYRDRNVFVEDYVERERGFCSSLDSIELQLPEIAARVAQIEDCRRALVELRSRIHGEFYP